jgi:hypothetical protein
MAYEKNLRRTTPRGLRNNNPGNIRKSNDLFQGETASTDPQFKQFVSTAYGYRALMRILINYITKYHLDTVAKIIARYAPASENATDKYVSTVCERTGYGKDDKLTVSEETLCKLASAISYVENGMDADESDVNKGYSLLDRR